MNTSYRHGALMVVEAAKSPVELRRELKALDPRLFFERQITLAGEDVWCVVLEGGGDQPPYTILEWRDEHDRPIELSSGVLHRVRAMMAQGDASKLGAEVAKANQERIERKRREHQEAWEEMVHDMLPRIEGRMRTPIPRGPYLRTARSKERARGRKV